MANNNQPSELAQAVLQKWELHLDEAAPGNELNGTQRVYVLIAMEEYSKATRQADAYSLPPKHFDCKRSHIEEKGE